MKEFFISKPGEKKSSDVPHQEDWGSIHPEMEALKLKYKDKDFFIFNYYKISSFLRLLYEGEEQTFNPAAIEKACEGKPCVGLLVLRVVDKKRGITKGGRGRGMYFLNEEGFDVAVKAEEIPLWMEDKQGLYVPKKMLKNKPKKMLKNKPKGFKNNP